MYYTAWVNSRFQSFVLAFTLLVGIASCEFLNSDVIAEIEGKKLKESDFIAYAEAIDIDPTDSLREAYVQLWIRQQAINLYLAEKDIKRYTLNKSRNEETFASLNLFELENILIESKLDTIISENEIIEYYEQNRENYLTDSYIVKALYIKIPDSSDKANLLEEAFLLKKDKDLDIIEKYANIYSANFYFEEKKWIFFEDLARDIPLSEESKVELILTKGEKILKDNNYRYLLNIFDYRSKKTTAPLAFERERIKKHILKRRVNKLRGEVENKLLNEIDEKYKVKLYY